MGLSKAVILPTGTTVNYWRLNAVSVDLESNYSKARVGGYISKADALLKRAPYTNIEYSFRGSENPIEANSDPLTWKPLMEDKIRGADIDENETDLERAQRLSMTGVSGTLFGATIVSDLPD